MKQPEVIVMKILARMAFVIVAFVGLIMVGCTGIERQGIKVQSDLGNWTPLAYATLQMLGGWSALLIAWFGMLASYQK